MVGARFRRNKAKPCRGLLIRARGGERLRRECCGVRERLRHGCSAGEWRSDAAVDVHCAPMGPWRRGCGRSGGSAPSAGWRDSRAVCDSRGQRSEEGPSLARFARYAFPDGALQRFSDAWCAYLAKASSFWIHGDDILPRRGAFPVRGPFGNA